MVSAGLAGSALPAQTGQPPTTTSSGARVFYGNIRTMDDKNTVAQAVAVNAKGVIIHVGTAPEAEEAAGAGFEKVQLAAKQTLLPGFIDSHMHVEAQLLQKSGLIPTVGACPPKIYTPLSLPSRPEEPCYPYIADALDSLQPPKTAPAFIVAIFLDPSRQPYDAADLNPEDMKFKQCPSQYIEEHTSKDVPVLIVDQSGHFGYVNRKAFEVLEADMAAKGKNWPPVFSDGGLWNVARTSEGRSPAESDLRLRRTLWLAPGPLSAVSADSGGEDLLAALVRPEHAAFSKHLVANPG